jgi:hypothetical protein
MSSLLDVQVYCDSPCAQIVHAQYAANHIATKIIEDEHLPYGLAFRVEDGRSMWDEAIGGCCVVVELGFLRDVVQVENALDGGCRCC